jgi:predicted peptidase
LAYGKDATTQWPLILFLHGSGERGYNINQVRDTGLPRNVDTQPDFPFIVIAPQCSPEESWSPAELNDLLDRIQTKYRVDTRRVCLTGLSMGGYGSWSLAIDSPNRFAAVAPICGGGDPADAGRLKGVPFWVFHGGKDPVVPLQSGQDMVDALKKAGGNVKFTVFPEDGHDSWTDAYAMPELYDWLLKQHR